VLVGLLRIDVDEPTGHDQVLGHPVGILLAERLELTTGDLVEITGLHVVGDVRDLLGGTDGLDAERIAVFRGLAGFPTVTTIAATGRAGPGGRPATVVATRPPRTLRAVTVRRTITTLRAITVRRTITTLRAITTLGAVVRRAPPGRAPARRAPL
jgi:hypothetical protein